MSQPTASAVHVNRPLSNVSVAYIQRQTQFVAPRVFPIVRVAKQSDLYFTYTKNDWFRDEAKRRAPATESAGSGYGVSTASYDCKVWALHKDIPDQVRNNDDADFTSDRQATEFITQMLLLRQEIQWTADFFVTGVWGTSATPAALWSNYGTSDPVADVATGSRTILANTGMKPNKLVLGYDVFLALRNHPDIIDRLKYTGGATRTIGVDALAALFDVDEVLVCEAVKATNLEGETAAMAFVQGKHALLCYSAPSPGLLTPSAGYIFVWQGVSGSFGLDVGIQKIRMELVKADRIEGEIAFDDKIVGADLGYMFVSAVA